MNAADAYNLAVSQFERIDRLCDEAEESDDADPWFVIDGIRGLCQDTLLHLKDVRS